MNIIEIYIEGGGDDYNRRADLRLGMKAFLGKLENSKTEQPWELNVICCGSRTEAFREFKNARQKNDGGDIAVLLVDSEGPVEAGASPRDHLRRETRGDFDGTPDDLMHLMAQTMEAWIVSDLDALRQYYDEKFVLNKIPQGDNMEVFPKRQVSILLKSATRRTKQGKYHKINHAKDILKLIKPSVVRGKCPHCDRLFTTLESLINGPIPA